MNKPMFRFCPFLLLVAPVLSPRLQAQPVINIVVNAAGYKFPFLPHSDIAQGSMFVVFGQQLGPAALQQATVPFGPQLGGTSIRITGGGVTADAVLVYTSAAQVAAILPSRIPPGDATMTVTYLDKTSAPASIRVARSSFGIFTRNQAGSGPGIVQNYNSATDQPVNALTAPVRPGQVMILWGTGLGPVDYDDAQLPRVGDLNVDVQVVVEKKSARILYKGRSPQFPGIDQINFEVPADAPVGCHVPLAVRAGGVVSNFASIAIASAGAVCSDAIGFSAADFEKLRTTGQLRIGQVALIKQTFVDLKGTVDSVTAYFNRHDQATAVKALSVVKESYLPYGTCTVISGRAVADSNELPGDPTVVERLRGGASINLQGPRGAKQFERRGGDANYYGASLGGGLPGFTGDYGPEYLVPGLYTVDHPAGPDVGAFSATLTLPAPIQWTNRDSFSVLRRSQDLTVTWTGGDSAKEYVVVGATSLDMARRVGASITCVARASAGQFTIPAWLLSTLPASSGPSPGGSLPNGRVEFSTYTIVEPARFQAQGIDVGNFGYEVMTFKLAAFQ
jgi:uncharacterized protein (TIGR03437 family)